MDPIFASIILAFLVTVIALVAITYRQKDIAALALNDLNKLSRESFPNKSESLQDDTLETTS